jgi:HEAT repeat protein
MKTKQQNNKSIRIVSYCLTILLILLFCTCAKQTNILATDKSVSPAETVRSNANLPEMEKQTDSQNDNQDNPLKKLLSEASWDSIPEAKRQGKSALPIIRPFLKDENYQVRQMAVSSAGAIGDDAASDILASGLKDTNINVRLSAANELSKQAYPSATETVLEVIKTTPDDTVREVLVKAAGFLPGDKTIATLRPLTKGKNVLADQAIYALAKLGDSSGLSLVSGKLSAALPRTRYETLQNLCYINNSQFVPKAKQLLSDKAEAIRVGSVRNSQMRRVADAAVDALVCLLDIDLPFKPSKNLYTNEEINQVRTSINKKEK